MARQDREEKKKQIALMALDVFAVHGFHQSSIRALASAMNISKGTLYDYFNSKEDIISYVAKEYLIGIYKSEVALVFDEAKSKNMSPKETIRFLLKAAIVKPMEVKKYLVVFSEIGTLTIKNEIPEIRNLFKVLLNDLNSYISDILKNAQKNSSLPHTIDADAMAFFLTSSIRGLKEVYEMFENKYDYELVIDNFINAFFKE